MLPSCCSKHQRYVSSSKCSPSCTGLFHLEPVLPFAIDTFFPRRSRTHTITSTECTTTTTGQISMRAKLLMALGGSRDLTLFSFQMDALNMSSNAKKALWIQACNQNLTSFYPKSNFQVPCGPLYRVCGGGDLWRSCSFPWTPPSSWLWSWWPWTCLRDNSPEWYWTSNIYNTNVTIASITRNIFQCIYIIQHRICSFFFTIDRCLFCGPRLESYHLDITSSSQTNKSLVKSASEY